MLYWCESEAEGVKGWHLYKRVNTGINYKETHLANIAKYDKDPIYFAFLIHTKKSGVRVVLKPIKCKSLDSAKKEILKRIST